MANNLFEKSFNIKNNTYYSTQFKPLWGQKGVFTSIPVIGKTPRLIGLNKYLRTFNTTCRDYKFATKIDLSIIRSLVGGDLKKIKYFNHLLRIATNGTTLSISLRKRIKTKDSVIGFIKKYKRRDFKNKNLFYKKLLKFMSEINYSENEIILLREDEITEGAVTNLVFVKGDKIYIPKTGYYHGNTLKLIEEISKSKFTINCSFPFFYAKLRVKQECFNNNLSKKSGSYLFFPNYPLYLNISAYLPSNLLIVYQ